jgi:hypothetical protein
MHTLVWWGNLKKRQGPRPRREVIIKKDISEI